MFGSRASAEAPSPEAARTSSLIALYPGLEKTRSLEELRTFIGECTRCKLCSGRTHLVFGVGNPSAQLMFVGEGPGADEDLRGEPFVGRAGQLLTDIIERGMGLRRAEVYICNVVKCRPPNNRNPEADEVLACEPFLMRQIELVRPRVIVVEAVFPMSFRPTHSEWEPTILAAGYRCALFDGINRFYAQAGDQEALRALSFPACELDGYVGWSEAALHDAARQVAGHLTELSTASREFSHCLDVVLAESIARLEPT